MNNILRQTALSALLMVAVAPTAKATIFFSDSFTNGSTVNAASPANPTTNSTAYETVSSKSWVPNPPTLNSRDFKVGIGATTSGSFEEEALFATNALALTQTGDFIQLTVTFTNTAGLLTEAGQLGFGLYNSGQVKPLGSGMNGTATTSTTSVTGGAQNWQGYVGQINFGGSASRIMTRPLQSATTGNNQDLITSGSGSSSYAGSSTVGSTVAANLTLTVGATYTEVLNITLNDVNSLAITNTLYAGPDTSGTVVTNFGGVATGATFLTGGFDGLAIGYRAGANASANTMDISSIVVTGSVTPITGPPTITTQPTDVNVPNGGSCAFSVAATGFDVTYQWHRNGTNLLNGGNISGATSSQLIISPAGPADVFSGANGYYVTVTGAGPFSTNSMTNALAFVTAKNLIYSGSGPWDLNNSTSWLDNTMTPGFTFNFGDAVTFDNTGAGGVVTLTGSYLSASSVTVNESGFPYTFTGTGSFAGLGNLIYEGSAQFTVNNANTYSGGTIISNATANLRLGNLGGLGSGPITMALAGGQMELLQNASSSTSLPNDLIVADDFTFVFDGTNSSFVGVLNGNISGTSGKTLTINHGAGGSGTSASRIRLGGTNTVCNANIFLNDSTFVWSPSQGSGSQTYNGVISGSGSFLQKNSTSILNGPNTYTGGTIPAAGTIGLGVDSVGSPTVTSGPIGTGPLLLVNDSTTTLTGSGQIFAAGGAHTLGNAIQYQSASNNLTLVVGGVNNLTLSGAFTLNGNDGLGAGTNRTVQATNTALTTISGVISDGGLGIGLIKTGAGILALANTETYTGPTTVSAGTLRVDGSLTASSLVTVATNATLAGTGTVNGSVSVSPGGMMGAGDATIGTLTVSGNLTNNGNGFFRVNRSGSASDKVSVSGTLTNTGTGTITVTNLGTALQVGDTFALFNKAMSNGAAMTITGGGAAWLNKLAVDGTIQVVPGVNTNPAPIVFSISGNTLNLQWPPDRIGWRLLSQTNTLATGLKPATNNWFMVAGSATVSNMNFTVSPTNPTVFYRLTYP